jgi:hypothetical protein
VLVGLADVVAEFRAVTASRMSSERVLPKLRASRASLRRQPQRAEGAIGHALGAADGLMSDTAGTIGTLGWFLLPQPDAFKHADMLHRANDNYSLTWRLCGDARCLLSALVKQQGKPLHVLADAGLSRA